MKLVEQHIIKKNNSNYNELDNLCFLSKNLYNSTLYSIRQHYFNTKKYLNVYENINNFTRNKQQDYVKLPAKVSQQIMLIADKNFKSFFKLLKNKQNGSYKEKVNIPKYINKNGRFILLYDKQCISSKELKKGFVKLTKLNLKIKTNKKDICQVRIIPKNNYFVFEIVYNIKEKDLIKDNNRYCSIDLGINNLATITSNIIKPLIINGKPLKSINQYYNKKSALLKSKLKINHNRYESNRTRSLNKLRNNKIKDYLHKASRYIVNYLAFNNISALIIGKNDGWKQKTNIGVVNNQNFVNIPFNMLINMLTYKCKLEGIKVIMTSEAYTSKCSFIDNEPINKHETYKGKRVKRGLFRTSNNKLINADVNGSLNIMRKVVPNALIRYEIEVCSTPLVLTIK